MNRFYAGILIILLSITPIFAVGEAGAIFLLITPGAGPAGTGEAQVAKADDAYASYFNPAGLAFLPGTEYVLMHVNWLPNLADDLYYEFLGYRKHINNLGTVGGHFIFLNLGEQTQTDEHGNEIDRFTSNMWALTGSFSTMLSEHSGVGISMKVFQQNLISGGVAAEAGSGVSTDFAFDIGYLRKSNRFNFGLSVTNIGPKIAFIDINQADPAPTNLRLGVDVVLFKNEFNRLNLLFDINKMLVASYPDMDWDGDGLVGGFDKDGGMMQIEGGEWGEYNSDGKIEWAHSDPWYLAVFTSWLDDWYLGGDRDWTGEFNGEEKDHRIGGWSFKDGYCDNAALPDGTSYTCYDIIEHFQLEEQDRNGKIDHITEEIGETDVTFYPELYASEPFEDANENGIYDEGIDIFLLEEHDIDGDGEWSEGGDYNAFGIKEVGSGDERSIKNEFIENVYNLGLEYWYTDNFALRAGFIYDEEGSIKVPTLGAGIRFGGYGFDFGYTAGEEGHPRANTMFFSINMEL